MPQEESCKLQSNKKCTSNEAIAAIFLVAMITSTFSSILFIDAILEWHLYQWLRTFSFPIKLGVSIFNETILLWSIFAIGWTNSDRLRKYEMPLECFKRRECWFGVLRTAYYVRTLIMVMAAAVSKPLRLSICFGAISLIHTISVGCCVYHTVLRISFRRGTSFFIALSGGMVFMALLMLPYPSELLLGFLNGTLVYNTITRLTTYLATGIIVAGMTGVVSAIGKKGISRIYLPEIDEKSDRWESFKSVRMRLLTHIWTDSQSFWKVFRWGYMLFPCLILGACISVFAPLIMMANAEETSFSFFLGILGTGLLFLGVVLQFNTSDESLLKAEYNYISFKLLQIEQDDVKNGTTRWKDYCQVVSNMYCNHTGITSEDDFLCKLWEPTLRDMSKKTDVCEAYLILCLVQAHHRTSQMFVLNSTKSELVNTERLAADLIQHNFQVDSLNSAGKQASFIGLIYSAFVCLLENNRRGWERRFHRLGVNLEKAMAILFVDILNIYTNKEPEGISDCTVRSFCTGTSEVGCICKNVNGVGCRNIEVNQKVFLLSFPITVLECMKARWGDGAIENSCWVDFEAYFVSLYKAKRNDVSDAKVLEETFFQWILDVYPWFEHIKDCARRSANKIEEEAIDERDKRFAEAKNMAIRTDMDIQTKLVKILSDIPSTLPNESDKRVLMTLVFLEFYNEMNLKKEGDKDA